MKPRILLAVLGLATAFGCGVSEGAGPTLGRRALVEEKTFWWIAAGELTSAGAWIGPLSLDRAGSEVRPWTLTVALPGTSERLACLQGQVSADGREPIELKGSAYHVRLVPRPGLTWRATRSVEDLEEVAVGFDL